MRITRAFEIDAGHRLVAHEGKCASVHGHRYCFQVQIAPRMGRGLDSVGRVLDFGAMKRDVGDWLDRILDHAMIVQDTDPLLPHLDGKVVVVNVPPTIEHLVRLVYLQASELLGPDFEVVHVRGYETPNCWADHDARTEQEYPAGHPTPRILDARGLR